MTIAQMACDVIPAARMRGRVRKIEVIGSF
jgi:hypothetical protein